MNEQNDEYKLYETPATIEKQWDDSSLIGVACDHCGMDDAPIVIRAGEGAGEGSWSKNKCKWCAELHTLNYHLRMANTTITVSSGFRLDPIRLVLHGCMLFGIVIFLSGVFLGWENGAMGAMITACIGGALYGYEDVKGDVSDDA